MLQHPRSEEEFHLKLSADDVPHDLSTPLMNCSFRVREQNEVSGPKINTLCALFGQSAYGSGHIEYLNKTYHISFESAKQYKCTSLSQALLTQHELKLTLQKLYRLALTLASSFVQLKDSPWLFTSWDKRSVLFLDPQNNGKLVLDVPFVSRTFDPPYATQSLGHDVDSIVSLGIVLVELCLGQAIERHPKRLQSPEASDRMKFGLDLLAALQLLDDVNGKAGPDYAAAIGWCLTGCRMVPDDGTWRKEMVRKVVAPLERGYNYISRTP
jgi:hypothetical protein